METAGFSEVLVSSHQSTRCHIPQDRHLNYLFFCHGARAPVGQDLHIVEDSRSHSDTPQWIGLPCTIDQPDAVTST